MKIREYKKKDLSDIVRIWNEVVEEDAYVFSG